mgnify:CR=1 FL=1
MTKEKGIMNEETEMRTEKLFSNSLRFESYASSSSHVCAGSKIRSVHGSPSKWRIIHT